MYFFFQQKASILKQLVKTSAAEIATMARTNRTDFRVIDTAASQLTKTAITVTAIFIVALGYDFWYYILAYSGVADYIVNSPPQKIGMLTRFFFQPTC